MAYSVEKLCFEKGGVFICDLSVIQYCRYEGGGKNHMRIRPDATQRRTCNLWFARQVAERFLRILLQLRIGVFQQNRPKAALHFRGYLMI